MVSAVGVLYVDLKQFSTCCLRTQPQPQCVKHWTIFSLSANVTMSSKNRNKNASAMPPAGVGTTTRTTRKWLCTLMGCRKPSVPSWHVTERGSHALWWKKKILLTSRGRKKKLLVLQHINSVRIPIIQQPHEEVNTPPCHARAHGRVQLTFSKTIS